MQLAVTCGQVLGVQREASAAQIRKAYLQLCLTLHPDKNPGNEVRTPVVWVGHG
jgi:DnaJ-class molecular chaperone